jgi:hypothetical protein
MFNRMNFNRDKEALISRARSDSELIKKGIDFVAHADRYNYGYYWTWMDLPIIQMPEDIMLTQELIWEIKPDYVIELGIAWGGSLAMYATFLEFLGQGRVIGIDITIPPHNAKAIMSCPVSSKITLIEGSSIDTEVFNQVKSHIPEGSRCLLILDSNHTHDHVYQELVLWSKLVLKESYIIVSDTFVENIPIQQHRPRPWGPGNNPGTATKKFLSENPRFSAHNSYSNRAIASFNPFGYLHAIE